MGGGHPPPRILIIYKNNYERMITNMQNELLDLIDQIEMQQAIAEMEVCNALLNSYSKSCMILENASDTADLSSYSIFQESAEIYQEGEKWDKVKSAGSQALKDAKGKESESLIIRILKFIPRLIASFIRNLRANKKQMEKKIDVIEKSAEEIVEAVEKGDDKGNHLVIDTNDVHWVDKDGKIIGSGIEAVEKGIDEDAAKNKKSAESPDTSKFVMKDGGKQLDDKAVRKSRRESFNAQQTLEQPMKKAGSNDMTYLTYANGDIRVNFPLDTFDLVTELSRKSLDYAEIVVPVEDALNMLVDTFSEDRIDPNNGYLEIDQDHNRRTVVGKLRTRDIPGLVTRIQNKIDEADKYLKKLDQFFADNNKEIKNKDVRDVMLSEVLKLYRSATGWMGYTEKFLSVTATRIKETTEPLPTLKSGSAHNSYYKSDLATYLKPEDVTRITQCVNMLQHTVDVANKQFGYIVGRCNDGLNKVYTAVIFVARKAGITVDQSLVDRRRLGKNYGIPHYATRFDMLFFGDTSNGNANRHYKSLI